MRFFRPCQAPHVKCCHPGRRFLIGYSEVIQSWQQMFSDIKEKKKISVTEIRIVTASDMAWVTCVETFDRGMGQDGMQILSTNIFRAQRVGRTTKWLLEGRASSRLISGL